MTPPPGWQSSRAKRWQAAAIAAAVAPLVRALSWTWRWRVEGGEHLHALDASGEPAILALWHGRIMPGLTFWGHRGIVVITSENFDGEWIARVLVRFGFGTARGSTSRGGVKALVKLKKEMAGGHWTAFTVDGPRGPYRVAQPGAVWLARATGRPILPFHPTADRHWTLRSWDRTQIPRPFATITMRLGEPVRVAPEEDVDAALARLQGVLEALAGTD